MAIFGLGEWEVVGVDEVIRSLAARQFWVVERGQLLARGVSRDAIKHRLARGWLVPLYRRVYLVSHSVLPPLAREMAAVLSVGPHSAISHESSASIDDLVDYDGPVHVTLSQGDRRPPGIVVHRSPLTRKEVRYIQGVLPVTRPARTIADLAATRTPDELERILNEAEVKRLVTRRQLAPYTHTPRRGAHTLATLLTREPAWTQSEAEEELRNLIRRANLPTPAYNKRIGRWRPDVVFEEARLVVEVDGFRSHGTRAQFERDRRKDADLLAAGYRVLRVTWIQLKHEPEAVLVRMVRALERPVLLDAA